MTFLIDIGSVVLVVLAVVLVHEFGHFVVAKWSRIRVDEFAVGFGPRIWSRQFGETVYSWRLLPLGGFVRMAGMLGLRGESDAGERNFYRAPIPKRVATILAGVTTNLLFAILCFTIFLSTPTTSTVLSQSAAKAAGLRDGDQILAVNGHPIRHDNEMDVSTDLHAATAASAGEPVKVVYMRGGISRSAIVRPALVIDNERLSGSPGYLPPGEFTVQAINGRPVGTGDPAQLLGGGEEVQVSGALRTSIAGSPTPYTNVKIANVEDGDGAINRVQAAWRLGVTAGYDGESVPAALAKAVGSIPTFFQDSFSGLIQILTTSNSGGLNGPNGLSGPVGIARETVQQTNAGAKNLLWWVGFLSENLALVNLLPIPFLDGGKFWFLMLEAVRRKRLSPEQEAMAYAVSLALVVLFAIYVTIGDIQRPV